MSRDLTPKQEAFVLAYLETGNAMEAYRRAYDASGMSQASIDKEARRLLDNPRITPRLQKYQERKEVSSLLSLEEHMTELKKLRDAAVAEGKFGPAVTAEVKRGELRRFYVKQVENAGAGDFDNLDDDELSATIAEQTRQLAEADPEFAAQLGRKRATKH